MKNTSLRPRAELKDSLDRLYASFDHPESALDPVQIVRRYSAVDDREVVAFVAAGLAFGRVASVMASVDAVCRAMGPKPASFVRTFDPDRHGASLRGLVHRWVRGVDLVALLWILRVMIERHGSLEAAMALGVSSDHPDIGPAIERFADEARAIDLSAIYGRAAASNAGVYYFFSRPSTGGACKRINLFLRWMSRRDGVDPGGWTAIRASQLVVPLDTHTIRVGKCLRFTTRVSPGWKMAADITAALRAIDPEDPVRYDFALCHLSMMGACGWRTDRGSGQCPLKAVCKPGRAIRSGALETASKRTRSRSR